jgi:hypothetical protein
MVRASFGLDDVDMDADAAPHEAPRRFLETPWPAAWRSGPARDERARQGDLRAYTVGDWLLILLRLSSAGVIAALVVGGLAGLVAAPLWLALSL